MIETSTSTFGSAEDDNEQMKSLDKPFSAKAYSFQKKVKREMAKYKEEGSINETDRKLLKGIFLRTVKDFKEDQIHMNKL